MGNRVRRVVAALACLCAVAAAPATAAEPHEDFEAGPPRLGLIVQPMTPELRVWFAAPPGVGVLVSRVVRGGPAEEAGVEVGDVVIEASGEEVRSRRDLVWKTVRTPQGDAVQLVLVRRGQRVEIDVVPKGRIRPPVWDRDELWGPLQAPLVRELREGLKELEKRLETLEEKLEEDEPDSEERT